MATVFSFFSTPVHPLCLPPQTHSLLRLYSSLLYSVLTTDFMECHRRTTKPRHNNPVANPKVMVPYKVSTWPFSITDITIYHIITFSFSVLTSTGNQADNNTPLRQPLSTVYITAQQLIPTSYEVTIPPITVMRCLCSLWLEKP